MLWLYTRYLLNHLNVAIDNDMPNVLKKLYQTACMQVCVHVSMVCVQKTDDHCIYTPLWSGMFISRHDSWQRHYKQGAFIRVQIG